MSLDPLAITLRFIQLVENVFETLDEHWDDQALLKPLNHFKASKHLCRLKAGHVVRALKKVERNGQREIMRRVRDGTGAKLIGYGEYKSARILVDAKGGGKKTPDKPTPP